MRGRSVSNEHMDKIQILRERLEIERILYCCRILRLITNDFPSSRLDKIQVGEVSDTAECVILGLTCMNSGCDEKFRDVCKLEVEWELVTTIFVN